MNTLNSEDLIRVAGGVIGGSTTRSGIPLCDSSATREPGQNSYGESVLGGVEHYYTAMGLAEAQIRADAALTTQLIACSGSNPVSCMIATINALNAVQAIMVNPPPYVKGPQGK